VILLKTEVGLEMEAEMVRSRRNTERSAII